MKNFSIIRDGKTIELSLREAMRIAEDVRVYQAQSILTRLIEQEDDDEFKEWYGFSKESVLENEKAMQDMSSDLAQSSDGLLHDEKEDFWAFLNFAIKEYV